MLLAALAAAFFATACDPGADDGPAGDKVLEPSAVRSALNDPFTTPMQPQLATAAGPDRFLDAWLVNTGTSTLVVGQVFDAVRAPLGPVQVWNNTTHGKIQPRASYDPLTKRFLVTWEDLYSGTDHDVLGVITDNVGTLISSPVIDFSSFFEQQPSVTWVGGNVNKWLVTYERFTNVQGSSDHRVRGRYVDGNGAFGLTTDMTAPSSASIFRPQAQYVAATDRILLSWGDLSRLFVTGASPATLVAGAASTLTVVGSHIFDLQQSAYNSLNGLYALAFRDVDTSQDGIRKIRLKLFPFGCESFACTLTERPTSITMSATITAMGGPAIAPLIPGFVLFAGQSGANLPNGESIKFAQVNQTGVVTTSNDATIPACAAPLWNNMANAVIAATSTLGHSRSNLIYDSYCPVAGVSKVMGQTMNNTAIKTDFRVSD
jgi:hypothetical protein